jgi:hypothetical protein
MVHNADGTGRPDHCSEPVVWAGDHRLASGKKIRVWSCDGHREAVTEAEPWPDLARFTVEPTERE